MIFQETCMSTTSSKGITYYEQTKKIFGEASMNICQWASNDQNLMSRVKVEDNCPENVIKFLGMIFNVDVDKLYISEIKDIMTRDKLSKRKMLQNIASIHDPFGLLGPIIG